MPRLIWVFAGRTFILLVLSCRGSFNFFSVAQPQTFGTNILTNRSRTRDCQNVPKWKPKYAKIHVALTSQSILETVTILELAMTVQRYLEISNSGQLIFKYVFSKIFHYNHRCDQQNYIILEVVTRPFSKKYKMSNKDLDKDFSHLK